VNKEAKDRKHAPTHTIGTEDSRIEGNSLMQESGLMQAAVNVMTYLWMRRRLLVAIGLIALVVNIAIATRVKSNYQSTAEILPPQNGAGIGSGALSSLVSSAASVGGASEMIGVRTPSTLYVDMLQSRTLADLVIDRNSLMEAYRAKSREAARKRLMRSTTITDDRKAGKIVVSVLDLEPVRAAQVARSYIDCLNTLLTERSTTSAHLERVFLEGRLASIREELTKDETELSNYSSQNGAYDTREQLRAVMDEASRIEAQLLTAEADMKSLQAVYAADSTRVKIAEARVKELRNALNRVRGNNNDGTKKQGTTSNLSLRELPKAGIEYADRYRKVMATEALYEVLTKQWEQARVQEAKEVPTVQVLDYPEVPTHKFSPSRVAMVLKNTMSLELLVVVGFLLRMFWNGVDPNNTLKLFLETCVREGSDDLRQAARKIGFGKTRNVEPK